MSQEPLSLDTPPDIERLQVEAWRRMSPQQKAETVCGLTEMIFNLASAGVRQRYPDASTHEQRLRLALVILGPDLAGHVFPEITALSHR